MPKQRLVQAAALVAALFVVAGWFYTTGPFWRSLTPAGERAVHIEGNIVRVAIADTDAKRQLGLSGRAALAPDSGMLFVFPVDGRYGFWMKDMRFSIDILWLSSDGTIVHIEPDVSPDTYPQAFAPDAPARYVLEVNAGYAAAHGISVGDKAQF